MSSTGIVNFEDATIQAVEMYATEKMRIGVLSSDAKFAVGGDIEITGGARANYFVGDGSNLTGISGGSGVDVTQTLALSNVTTGLTVSSNVVVDGNVTADYFVGDGSNLTGISGGSGVDVTQTLALSNVTTGLTVSSNVVVDGNVTADYFVGDGSNLTGISGGSGVDVTQTLALSNVTTGLTVDSNASVGGVLTTDQLKVLSSIYHNDDAVLTTTFGSDWIQRGGDINGEVNLDQSGYSVSLSSDGSVVAIGAPYNDANGTDAGHTRVYAWDGSDWVKRGDNINGEVAGDNSGWSVSLSSDGSVVAIGAPYNDGNGTNSGHTRVYAWDGTNWVKRGDDIDGEAADDRSGHSVSLSSDGSVVAIGAINNDANGGNSGHVRVYEWSGSAWLKKGLDIDGEAAGNYSGWSVSISSDGSIVAIGAYLNGGTASNAGHVRVYAWSGSAWLKRGDDIDGEAGGDQSGYSVSLSSDGSVVAIGARYNDGNGSSSGHVRVYAWSGSAWLKRGDDIDGGAAEDLFGWSVSLSGDGSKVIAGATLSGLGQARAFIWDGSAWVQLGVNLDGKAGATQFGWSVSFSSDGSSVAIGSIYGPMPVRVYKLPSLKVLTTDKLYTTSNVGIGTSTPAYTLDVVGDVYASGTITQSSDARLKSNLEIISQPVEKINQIRGYTYDLNNKRRTGLIAQEVLEILPEAVVGDDENGYGLAYGDMMGLLVEAIKTLNERIRILENN